MLEKNNKDPNRNDFQLTLACLENISGTRDTMACVYLVDAMLKNTLEDTYSNQSSVYSFKCIS